MIQELDIVTLTRDLPAAGLKAGNAGTVVAVHRGGEAYDVEFLDGEGLTLALESLRAGEIQPLRRQRSARAHGIAQDGAI
jgi:hypothetical protein